MTHSFRPHAVFALMLCASLVGGCGQAIPQSSDTPLIAPQSDHGSLAVQIIRDGGPARATQATSVDVDSVIVAVQQTGVAPVSQSLSASDLASNASSATFDNLTSGPATVAVTVLNAAGAGIGFAKTSTIVVANQTAKLSMTIQLSSTVTNATFGPGSLNATMVLVDGSSYVNNGIVSTLAGSTQGYKDGTGTAALFSNPGGIAQDAVGNLYVADALNNRIRMITPDGVVTTLAGGTQGAADGTGTAAGFYRPMSLVVDDSGNLYVADTNNHRIRKVTPAGVVSTVAGSVAGSADGQGTAATFNHPTGIAIDYSGNLYVADTGNNRVRVISPGRAVTTLAGSTAGYTDAGGTSAQFNGPQGLAVDSTLNVYVADTGNDTVRMISASGTVTSLAGNGSPGFVDATGNAALFNLPAGIAIGPDGSLYVADTFNNLIRKVTADGTVSTVAGQTQSGMVDDFGPSAQFAGPEGLVVGPTGIITVVDTLNQRIRVIQ